MKLFVALALVVAVTMVPSGEAAGSLDFACGEMIGALCGGLPHDQVKECLRRNRDRLSRPCHEKIIEDEAIRPRFKVTYAGMEPVGRIRLDREGKVKKSNFKHSYDKTGKTIVTQQDLIFPNNDSVSIFCEDWSNETNFTDALRISIRTSSYKNFLLNVYN